MGNSEQNRKAISENRKRIFSLDAEVMTNKTLIYASRSMIEENRLMILSNYSAAFMGNRQIANNNTDEIFENRHAILDNVDTQNDVEENFVNSQKNKASLDFLQHRSQLLQYMDNRARLPSRSHHPLRPLILYLMYPLFLHNRGSTSP